MEGSYLVRFLLSFYGIALISAKTISDDDSLGRIVYDQRQSGKFNIHVSIKDVAIIEMDQNEFVDDSVNDEDYYYDYNDLTVKPLPSWITKPTTTVPTSSVSTLQNDTTAQSIETTASQNITQSPIAALPLITHFIPNNTYSPNLLADLAATKAASTGGVTPVTKAPNSTTKRSQSIHVKHGTKKTTNLIILTTSPAPNTIDNATSTHMPIIANTELPAARSKTASPMHIIIEPVPSSKPEEQSISTIQNQAAFRDEEVVPPKTSKREEQDSKIFQFKVRRAHKQVNTPPGYPIPYRYRSYGQRRCRSGHFRDENGNCRVKRSSSILRKLFSMLVSLPLNETDDDESLAE